jgi:hypothetical protein
LAFSGVGILAFKLFQHLRYRRYGAAINQLISSNRQSADVCSCQLGEFCSCQLADFQQLTIS